jgi:RNA polymerase sigma factor (sigma-70 family)
LDQIQENSASEKSLVNRILQGETVAFGSIVRNTENLVAQIVFRMIPVKEDRKDIVQDIYLKAFHNLPDFKFRSKLSTWIAQISYNTCLSWIAKKKYLLPGDLHEPRNHSSIKHTSNYTNEAELNLYGKELSAILRREIQKLPTLYQTLVTLFHQESLSYEELSEITGLPSGTVKSYLFRARKMLKENILMNYKKEAL